MYLYKPLLHLLLPAWLPKVLVLDADVFVVADVRRLWAEFDRFRPAACAGLAVEQALSYAHVRARGGLNFNGGVQLPDLDRMRSSARYAARLADAADGRLPGLKADEKRIGFLGDQTLYSLMTVAPAANGTGDGRGLFHALPCGWNRQTGTHMAGWPGFWAAHACHERRGLLHFNFAGHKALAEALKAEAAAGGEWRAACRAVFDRTRRSDPLFRNGSADARMLGEVGGAAAPSRNFAREIGTHKRPAPRHRRGDADRQTVYTGRMAQHCTLYNARATHRRITPSLYGSRAGPQYST